MSYYNNYIKLKQFVFRSKYLENYLNTNLENNFRKLLEMLSICLYSSDYNLRPNCSQMIDTINDLSLDFNTISCDNNFEEFKQLLVQTNNEFLKTFFETKLEKGLKQFFF